MNAAWPPIFCASAITCRDMVVLPPDSGPKISITRPRGNPPTPKAESRLIEPVGITLTGTRTSRLPNRTMEPLPYDFSICAIAFARFTVFSSAKASPRKGDFKDGNGDLTRRVYQRVAVSHRPHARQDSTRRTKSKYYFRCFSHPCGKRAPPSKSFYFINIGWRPPWIFSGSFQFCKASPDRKNQIVSFWRRFSSMRTVRIVLPSHIRDCIARRKRKGGPCENRRYSRNDGRSTQLRVAARSEVRHFPICDFRCNHVLQTRFQHLFHSRGRKHRRKEYRIHIGNSRRWVVGNSVWTDLLDPSAGHELPRRQRSDEGSCRCDQQARAGVRTTPGESKLSPSELFCMTTADFTRGTYKIRARI